MLPGQTFRVDPHGGSSPFESGAGSTAHREGRRDERDRGRRVVGPRPSGLRRSRRLVPPRGFEPLISTLKGWRPRPLDDGGPAGPSLSGHPRRDVRERSRVTRRHRRALRVTASLPHGRLCPPTDDRSRPDPSAAPSCQPRRPVSRARAATGWPPSRTHRTRRGPRCRRRARRARRAHPTRPGRSARRGRRPPTASVTKTTPRTAAPVARSGIWLASRTVSAYTRYADGPEQGDADEDARRRDPHPADVRPRDGARSVRAPRRHLPAWVGVLVPRVVPLIVPAAHRGAPTGGRPSAGLDGTRRPGRAPSMARHHGSGGTPRRCASRAAAGARARPRRRTRRTRRRGAPRPRRRRRTSRTRG